MEYRNFPEISETEKFTLNIQFVISVAFLQTAGPAAVGPSRGRARRAPASAAARPGVGEIVEGSQRALDQILQQGGTSMRDFSIGSTVNASSHIQKSSWVVCIVFAMFTYNQTSSALLRRALSSIA